jgi:hypothetical protein
MNLFPITNDYILFAPRNGSPFSIAGDISFRMRFFGIKNANVWYVRSQHVTLMVEMATSPFWKIISTTLWTFCAVPVDALSKVGQITRP